jgi:cell division protein FtsB
VNGRTRPRPRLSRRAAGLAAISLLLATAGVVPARQYMAQRAELDVLQHQIELLEGERGRLERRLDRLEDPEYLERLARECLGMVKPGEIAFVAVPEDGEGASPGC